MTSSAHGAAVALARGAVALCLIISLPSWAQDETPVSQPQAVAPVAETAETAEPDYSLPAVLQKMRAHSAASKQTLEKREARYQERLQDAKDRLKKSQATLAAREAEGRRLDKRFESNKFELNDKAVLLKDKIGALKELFGVFQQNASDLIGAFNGSPTSIEYPDRDKWLEGFANRMKNASEVSSADDIKGLWFEVLREISASDDIVSLSAPVLDQEGNSTHRDIVRLGSFSLITNDPEPAYLVWKAGKQQAAELPRQPTGPYLTEIDAYMAQGSGGTELRTLSLDPTGGVLLSLLIEKPTLRERIDQGGLVGYMILGFGCFSLVVSALQDYGYRHHQFAGEFAAA
ncbi:MAG: hypothetical protein ACSHXK_11895 [Oceanococcus sp.]